MSSVGEVQNLHEGRNWHGNIYDESARRRGCGVSCRSCSAHHKLESQSHSVSSTYCLLESELRFQDTAMKVKSLFIAKNILEMSTISQ